MALVVHRSFRPHGNLPPMRWRAQVFPCRVGEERHALTPAEGQEFRVAEMSNWATLGDPTARSVGIL